ncbi:MAG TPA: S-layer family protein, partial [Allocoleopsis sp.]
LQLDPTVATGRGGDLKITTDQLIVRDRAAVTAATLGQGTGGNIQVQANSLALTNGAQVSAATSGKGQAGDISVREADAVSLTNSAISTAVNAGAEGSGGDIDIQTRSLSVRDQARISANTAGDGKAGSITVRGNTLEATNGGQLLTSTASGQDAGNINLTIKDDVKLTGEKTGIFANTTPGSTGNGGSILLNARTLDLRNGAGIAVGSQGTGEGGDITAQSNSTTLDNRAFISAKTASNTGGNITLGVQDLLMLRRGSEISTTAGTAQAGGDGGNITINAGFILGIPTEDSDITANAFTGRGGNINITTQGIFGLQFRPHLTPLSDITASSRFGLNGSVQIITLGVDPNRGLAELPTDLVDATGLIDRRCVPGGGTEQSSSFTITGRGGLPPNPNEALGEEGLLEDLGTSVGVSTGTRGGQQLRASTSPSSSPQQLVEAQGWVFAPDGTVILTAQAPTATPQHPWQTPASCQTLSQSSDARTVSPR